MKLLRTWSNNKLLKKINSKFPEIKEIIIVSNEGMPLKSTLSQDIEDVKVAGITLALLSAAKRMIFEMKDGNFKQLSIKSSKGYIIGYWLTRSKLLMVISSKEISFDSIF